MKKTGEKSKREAKSGEMMMRERERVCMCVCVCEKDRERVRAEAKLFAPDYMISVDGALEYVSHASMICTLTNLLNY